MSKGRRLSEYQEPEDYSELTFSEFSTIGSEIVYSSRNIESVNNFLFIERYMSLSPSENYPWLQRLLLRYKDLKSYPLCCIYKSGILKNFRQELFRSLLLPLLRVYYRPASAAFFRAVDPLE